jgi:hypothetical protein
VLNKNFAGRANVEVELPRFRLTFNPELSGAYTFEQLQGDGNWRTLPFLTAIRIDLDTDSPIPFVRLTFADIPVRPTAA